MTDTTPAMIDVEALRQGLWERGYGAVDAAWLLRHVDDTKRLRKERNQARADLRDAAVTTAMLDAHAHEVRLICDALEIDVPDTADPIIEAVATLRRERDEARLAHDTAKWMIDGQHEEIEYLRNRKDKPGCAQAHEDIATVEAETATLRRELAEARAERKREYDRGCATAAEELVTLRVERDEAVAETERVRKVYRDALAKLRGEVSAVAERLAAFSPCYTACDKAAHANAARLRAALDGAGPETAPADPQDDEQRRVYREAARRLADEYEIALGHARARPGYWGPEHDRIVRVYEEFIRRLRAALDGAATTGPETAPAEGGAS